LFKEAAIIPFPRDEVTCPVINLFAGQAHRKVRILVGLLLGKKLDRNNDALAKIDIMRLALFSCSFFGLQILLDIY